MCVCKYAQSHKTNKQIKAYLQNSRAQTLYIATLCLSIRRLATPHQPVHLTCQRHSQSLSFMSHLLNVQS